MPKKEYEVVTRHIGEKGRDYKPGDIREADENDVAHLVPNVLRPAAEIKKAPAVETKEAPAAETKEAPAVETKEAPAAETKEAPAAETKEANEPTSKAGAKGKR